MQALRIGLVLQPYTGAMPPHEYSIGPELIYKKTFNRRPCLVGRPRRL